MGTLSIHINRSCFVLFDFICLPDCPLVRLSVGLSASVCVHLSVCLFVFFVSVCLFCVPFFCLGACLPARLPASLRVRRSFYPLPLLWTPDVQAYQTARPPSCLSSLECKGLMCAFVFIPHFPHFLDIFFSLCHVIVLSTVFKSLHENFVIFLRYQLSLFLFLSQLFCLSELDSTTNCRTVNHFKFSIQVSSLSFSLFCSGLNKLIFSQQIRLQKLLLIYCLNVMKQKQKTAILFC